jgi:hypothetical protein
MRSGGEVGAAHSRLLTGRLPVQCVESKRLDSSTAAQYVGLGLDDTYRIQVNAAIPVGLRAAVARHLVEAHREDCTTVYCETARAWLGEACPATATRAS